MQKNKLLFCTFFVLKFIYHLDFHMVWQATDTCKDRLIPERNNWDFQQKYDLPIQQTFPNCVSTHTSPLSPLFPSNKYIKHWVKAKNILSQRAAFQYTDP